MQLKPDANSALHRICGGLVVSCQPVPGGPLDLPEVVVGFALAALNAGAKGLRVEGLNNLRAVRRATDAPIIGLIKRSLAASPVRITPLLEDVKALAEAGADIIAFDATGRNRPVASAQLCNAVRGLGRVAMADVSTLAEARAAQQFGADAIATTLAGYTSGSEPETPDFDLLAAAIPLNVPIVSEGCIRTPEQARRAVMLGAHAVVVGSAITRPEHIATWFKKEIDAGLPMQRQDGLPVLGIDIGGTKTIVSLVSANQATQSAESATLTRDNAVAWCDAVAAQAAQWRGQYSLAAAAVSGVVENGQWSALNPGTLAVPDGFPLETELKKRLGVPVRCFNDAQAAAWGEHRFGAGQRADLVFLTISSGIGGGIIQNGRLVTGRGGLAGNAGNTRVRNGNGLMRMEDLASGNGIAARARELGHDLDAKAIFALAAGGDAWACELVDQSLTQIADLLHNIQLMLDPPAFVIGGSIGLSPGFIDDLNTRLAFWPAAQRPEIRPAALGKFAGVIGAADLARHNIKP